MTKIPKVLVVDDRSEGRLMLSKLLTSNNYQVMEACNGIEALEFLKDSKPFIIISDIQMPEMDGLTIFRELENKIKELDQEIMQHKRTEESLKVSEEKYRDFFENASEAICIVDSNLQYLDVNNKLLELTGYSKEELLKMSVFDLIPPEQVPRYNEEFKKIQKKGHYKKFIGNIITKSGNMIDIEVNSSAIIEDGRIIGSRDVIRDITERKLNETEIEASLKEKEILLKEIHHRVKNNMQIISSLLQLASENIQEKKYADVFRESQNRIASMSLIHEKLYRSRDHAKIDIKEYIGEIINIIFQSHGVQTGTIALNINIENIQLEIGHSIPLGLIINELVTNSLKYAFNEDRKGEIKVSLHPIDTNTFELIVSDNGVGIPYDLDFKNTESLGLRLVSILVEDQLNGKIDLDRSKGTEFHIKFQGGNNGKKSKNGS